MKKDFHFAEMKSLVIILCLAVGGSLAAPAPERTERAIFDHVVDALEELGMRTLIKVIDVLDGVHDLILEAKEVAPKVMEKFHKLAESLLDEIELVSQEIRSFLSRKGVAHSSGLLDSLSELSDGTKLGLALRVMSIADKGHRLVQDLHKALPDAKERLARIMDKVELSLQDLSQHLVRELSGILEVDPTTFHSQILIAIEEMARSFSHETHEKILVLLHAVERTVVHVELFLPEAYNKVALEARELRNHVMDVLGKIWEHHFVSHSPARSGSVYDMLGTLTDGTKMGTVIHVLNIVDKYNTLLKDLKEAEPRAEKALDQAADVVAEHAKSFLQHVADKLLS